MDTPSDNARFMEVDGVFVPKPKVGVQPPGSARTAWDDYEEPPSPLPPGPDGWPSELDNLGQHDLADLLVAKDGVVPSALLSAVCARIEVLKQLPNLTKIDGSMITPSERDKAAGVEE